MSIRALALSVVALLAAVAPAPARAAPTIDIRAQTSLNLESVKLKDTGVAEVTGQLVDRLTGDGLGGERVSITVAGETTEASTQPDGRFRALVAVPDGQSTVELAFRGNALLDGASLTQITDPAREQVILTLVIDDSHASIPTITVRADAGGAVKLSVALFIGDAAATTLEALRTVETDAPVTLTRADVGGPGAKRIRAVFAGDPTRQPAQTEATFSLASATKTSMTLSTTDLPFEDELEVNGKVVDEDGLPMARAAVTLTSGDRRLAQGATGSDGTYRFSIEGEVLGEGTFAVQVQTEPPSSYYNASRTEPAVVRVHAPQPVPISYTIAAFVATGLAAGGFFLARTKPWQRLRRRVPAAEAPANESPAEVVDGGLVANRPSVMSTLRRPYDDGFSGVVRDTVRSRPVPDATVTLTQGETERSIRTAADGSFAIERLGVGDWTAEVAGPGHVTERFTVSIPHRGELRGVRVDLVPVRERVFQLYRNAAEPVLPEPRLWGIWSPRQIVDHVRAKRRSPAMSDLTDFVEEIYFSPRIAAEGVLPQAKDRVERAIKERTARPAGDNGSPRT